MPKSYEIEMLALDAEESSNIAEVGYDYRTRRLRVAFRSGGVYEYHGVPQAEYSAMLASKSKGQYFNEHIKGNPKYKTFKLLDNIVLKEKERAAVNSKPVVVATPVYLALLQAVKLAGAGMKVKLAVWTACGKPDKKRASRALDKYNAAWGIVGEAGGSLAVAVQMAADRKV